MAALCRQPAAPWVPLPGSRPKDTDGRLNTKAWSEGRALRERILSAGSGAVLQAVSAGKDLIAVIEVIKLLSCKEAALHLGVFSGLYAVILLDADKKLTTGKKAKDLPEELIIIYTPMLILRLEDPADLFVDRLVVLRDQEDLIAVFPVLAEELHPCKAVFPVPGPGVEQVIIRTFIKDKQRLPLDDLAPAVSLMELHSKIFQTLYVGKDIRRGSRDLMLRIPMGADAVIVPKFRGHVDKTPKPARMLFHKLKEILFIDLEIGNDIFPLLHSMVNFHGHMQTFTVAGTPGIEVDHNYTPVNTFRTAPMIFEWIREEMIPFTNIKTK